jgi:hypothetical protein
MFNALINELNEKEEKAKNDLEVYRKLGCNSFGCGVETGVIDTCAEIKELISDYINN